MKGLFTHSKTGNIYEAKGFAIPIKNQPPVATQTLIAHCCENKEVQVTVYAEDGTFFFVPTDNLNLHENTKTKVLYERDNVLWLRSKDDFEKPVDIRGVMSPRFQRIPELIQDQYKVISTDGELVFFGTLDEITEEFEIELERKLNHTIQLDVDYDETSGIHIFTSFENELRETEIIKLLMMYSTEKDIKNKTKVILNILGIAKVEKA